MRALMLPADPTEEIRPVDIDVLRNPQALVELIGNGCEYIERVRCSLTSTYDVVLVVDEEFFFHAEQHPNPRTRHLYPNPIHGNALLVAEGMTAEGPDFVTMDAETEEAVREFLTDVGDL